MILLIPVSRFRVDYEIGAGKPFSKLDLLLTRMLADNGAQSLDQLKHTFRLPGRLIIEMLVNLFHEEWLTMTAAGFELTAKGRAGVRGEIRPESHKISGAHVSIIMERVTGGLIPSNEIVYDTQDNLQKRDLWDYCYRLVVEYTDDRLDEGQVKSLLRRHNGQWVRAVAPPKMESKGWHWLPVEVSPEDGSVTGLPERWHARLRERLVAESKSRPPQTEARRYWSPGHQQRSTASDKISEGWPLDLSEAAVLWGGAALQSCLKRVLTTANRSVLIASAELDPLWPELREAFFEALTRGVTVDLLWGRTEHRQGPSPYPALDPYTALSAEVRALRGAGALRLNEQPLPSEMNLLVFDHDAGFRSVVTSHRWLTVPRADEVSIGIEFTHPGLISEICLSAVSVMMRSPTQQVSGGVECWRSIAADLDREAAPLTPEDEDGYVAEMPTETVVRIVHNQDHAARLLELERTAQSRFVVGCEGIDRTGLRRLSTLAQRRPLESPPYILLGKRDLAPENQAQLDTLLECCGARLGSFPGLTGSTVIADTTALIGTHSPWSAAHGEPSAEIALQIDGGPVPDRLWHLLLEQSRSDI